jgi:Ser-tRNA(Ala) deacylase AlaX
MELKKTKIKGVCSAKGCSAKSRTPGAKFCSRCDSRLWRENNPIEAAWINFCFHCKERDIPNELTFEEYKTWGIKVKYFVGKGRSKTSWAIDRINDDPAKGFHGYRLDNIQKLTVSDNSKKEQRKRFLIAQYDERERRVIATVI